MCFVNMQGMNIAKHGWFTELGSMWPGQGLSLKVKDVLYKGKSKFQVSSRLPWIVLAAFTAMKRVKRIW